MSLNRTVQQHKCGCGKATVQHENFVEALCRGCQKKDLELWAKQNRY